VLHAVLVRYTKYEGHATSGDSMSSKMQRILKPFHYALMSGLRADIDCMHIAQYEVVEHNSDNAVSGFHSPWGMGNLGNPAVRGLS
jgi:hypothetical protein